MACDQDAIARALALGPGTSEWSARRDAVQDALVDAGKCWAGGETPNGGRGWREQLEAAVRAYLNHPYPDLREAALRTLAVYWSLPVYKEVARAMAHADADPGVRATAVDGWSAYLRPHDQAALGEIARQLRDTTQPALVRAAAYRGLLSASGYLESVPRPQVSDLLDVFDDVDARVDWALVERLAGPVSSATPS